MVKRLLRIALFLTVFVPTTGYSISRQELINQTKDLKGLSGSALKQKLHELMQPHNVLGYGSGNGKTWWGFWQTDRNEATGEVINRYSADKFYFSATNNGSVPSGMNIEHSFPKSWWGGTKNDAYKDLFNLYPSDSHANSSKGNYPMSVVTQVKVQDGIYDKVGRGLVDGAMAQCWEPGDMYKGDFSRSYMYMAIIYSHYNWSGVGTQTMQSGSYPSMKKWATDLYRSWSRKDKANDLERNRNNAVYKIQGNRNLLIDFPYLVEYIWGDSLSTPFNPETSITTADDDSRYMNAQGTETGDPSVTPSNPPTPSEGGGTITGSTYVFKKTSTIEAGKKYLFVASNGTAIKAANTVKGTRGYGYLPTSDVNISGETITLNNDSYAFTLEAANGGYLIKDNENRYLLQKGTYTSFNVTTTATQASTWTVEAQADGTMKITANGYYIQFSAQHNSFGCYTTTKGTMPQLFVYDPTATGITAPNTVLNNNRVYNLQGQYLGTELNRLPKGVYIVNGKKISK